MRPDQIAHRAGAARVPAGVGRVRAAVRVEAALFCCVVTLTLCGLLRRELSREAIRLPVTTIVAELCGTCESDELDPPRQAGTEPELRTTLSQMSGEQRSLYDALDRDKYFS